jgi:signal transduction histidine kinase
MRRPLLIFIVAILTPTAFLSYFGLLAVRSEQSIIEKNMRERREFMAEIVVNEIVTSVNGMPRTLKDNREYLESVLVGEAAMFKDQAAILDNNGTMLKGPLKSFAFKRGDGPDAPALTRKVPGMPYEVAIYERYPVQLIEKMEKKKKGLYLYITIIVISAIIMLAGGTFTLWSLSREWRLARLKGEFVASLSHDLRRPLTSIRMFSEMLRDDRVPTKEKKRDYYNIINSESERLTHLANNILDFSRIETGKKLYNFKYENIANIVTDTVERCRTYMADETRKITLNIGQNIPLVRIDVNSISQALMNIISNAAKYSDVDKEIVINLSRAKNEVAIDVIDKGIGIPRSESKKIFTKFYRTSQKGVTEIEGSGLGLMLVKYIMEAHRGQIRVDSEVGKGSKFTMALPCTRS